MIGCFLLIMVGGDIDIPPNIHVYKCTFAEIRERIQSNFGFPISLNDPYKLCDYRPTYGSIFQKELQSYDFWGYCDLDQVFGHLSDFLYGDIFESYDKIGQHGHLTLFKNKDSINQAYKLYAPDCLSYREVFSTNIGKQFDEKPGIQKIFDFNGLKSYQNFVYADISTSRSQWTLTTFDSLPEDQKTRKCVYYYENGRVYGFYDFGTQTKTTEYAYIHFSGRAPSPDIYLKSGMNGYFFKDDMVVPKMKNMNVSNSECEKYNPYIYGKEVHHKIRRFISIQKRRIKKLSTT